jgi:hypothetical protein
MAEGVDYSSTRPNPQQLYAAGKRFVVRYGGPGGDWKHLTAAEAASLTGAGLALVANAEGAADGLLGGWDVGVSWARSADTAFRALGMSAGRPIYLSVDFDCGPDKQWAACAQALRGAASVLGPARVGVYGSYDVMQWAKRDGVARWYWQTYAWSGGRWAGHNNLEQYRNGVSLAGGTVDLCRSKTADYGQWGVDDMALTDADVDKIWAEPDSAADLNMRSAMHVAHSKAASAFAAAQINGTKLNTLTAKVDALTAAVAELANQINAGGGSVDAAVIVAAVDAAADRAAAETRDAVADLGEGGAAQVRADAE